MCWILKLDERNVNETQERTNPSMLPDCFWSVCAWWCKSQNQRTGCRATSLPSDRRPTDRPTDRPTNQPTRRRCGSPRDASRLRTAARLRCEPSHLASSTGVRPRAPTLHLSSRSGSHPLLSIGSRRHANARDRWRTRSSIPTEEAVVRT